MRPRRVRLGCQRRRSSFGAAIRSFNEAEARAPRMPATTCNGRGSISTGFNEAEARAPRMPIDSPTAARDSLDRFNEAEARARRMPLLCLGLGLSGELASMRPRRVRLGCPGIGIIAIVHLKR